MIGSGMMLLGLSFLGSTAGGFEAAANIMVAAFYSYVLQIDGYKPCAIAPSRLSFWATMHLAIGVLIVIFASCKGCGTCCTKQEDKAKGKARPKAE